ncbi:ubiquinol-cytochrome c reductase core subunit 1 [Chytriomyces hyalinus]|nr:ubiquinol-cytochrome c reductase core subunit 1 [Chytriomyces hyalinus]
MLSTRVVNQTRRLAVPASAVGYNRKGDQPHTAPVSVKALGKASNGVSVATLDGRGPVSSLALVIGAGSRHEESPGVAHLLKASLVRARPGDNIVRTYREFEFRGNTLYTSVSRENIIIGSNFLRDDLVDVVPSLINQVFNPSFQPYEFLDALPGVSDETAASLANPTTRVLDTLHHIAFRRGLGNSLFATDRALNNLKRSDLQAFASAHFTAEKIAIVGNGVAHDELEALVNSSFDGVAVPATSGAAPTPASAYFGGETRISGSGPSLVAIGFKSEPFTNIHAHATSLVLRAVLDGTQRLKWGSTSGATGLLAKAAAPGTDVTAFNASYTDAGLFGLYIKGNAPNVKSVAQRSIAAIHSVASINDADLSRAKKAAIVDAEVSLNRDDLIADIGRQVLASSGFVTVGELAQEISKVSKEDVAQAAKTLLSSKSSVVTYGDLSKLPYADEL